LQGPHKSQLHAQKPDGAARSKGDKSQKGVDVTKISPKKKVAPGLKNM